MLLVPTRFRVEFGDVFPFGCVVLGVKPAVDNSAVSDGAQKSAA